MDSSTLLRRTPAGDAEVVVPASGLSVTQRRILTLLDHPAHLGDLRVGRSLDAERLAHEAVRLQHAGLIVCETIRDTSDIAAANAATMHAPVRPRPLPIAVVLIAASVVVWAGWRHASVAPSSPDSRRHAGTAQTPNTPMSPAAEMSNEPRVIATRVLKGEVVDRNREVAKDRTVATPPTLPASVDASTPASLDVSTPASPHVSTPASLDVSTPSDPGVHDTTATPELPPDP